LSIFQKYFEKVKFLLKDEKNNGHFIWRPVYTFDHISLSYSDNEIFFVLVQSRREYNSKHYISSDPFSNILPFMRQCGKIL
jgi:hypothetical protein